MSLRRELDGRSVYTRPGVARYATAAQLPMEDKLVAQAQAQAAPRLTREQAARRLGADLGLLEAQLRERAQDARLQTTQAGLRLQHHGDCERFFAFRQTLPFIDVEQTGFGDELTVDAAGGAEQSLGWRCAQT